MLEDVAGKQAKTHPSPHLITKPKERLITMSRDVRGKARYSTNENPRLAQLLDLDACGARCEAFLALRVFVEGL